jgi:hypothetical protein
MGDLADIQAGHPLFKQLRNGLLWHRTSGNDYRRINADGIIKPNDGRIDRWGGRPYACQQLGAVSLFDFTTQAEDKVLWEAVKWQQFLGDFDPVTVLLGIERSKLSGKLIPYPENKQGTTGNVIPWVEVCHCGPIPTSAIVSCLLVCSTDYTRFKTLRNLDEQTLSLAEKEFGLIVQAELKRREARFSDWRAKIIAAKNTGHE